MRSRMLLIVSPSPGCHLTIGYEHASNASQGGRFMNDITPDPRPLDEPSDSIQQVPWTGLELTIIVVIGYLVWPMIVVESLRGTGFFHWYYGPEREQIEQERKSLDDSEPGGMVGTLVRGGAIEVRKKMLEDRERLWLPGAAFPFQIATILGGLAVLNRVRPADVGLSRQCLSGDTRRGVAWALFVTPVVLGLHFVIVLLYQRVLLMPTQDHPLALLGRQRL